MDQNRTVAGGKRIVRARVASGLSDLEGLISPQPWTVDALCAQTDPEAFFPEKGGSTRDAKRICASCPVAEECLRYALDNDERFGIWGGLSDRERRRVKKGQLPATPIKRQAKVRTAWTSDEDDRLRRLAADPDRTNTTIARLLNRPVKSVHSRRITLGIAPSRRRGRPTRKAQEDFQDEVAIQLAVSGEKVQLTSAERREALRRLVAANFSDSQIAERLHLNVRSVFRIRNTELGLPPVSLEERAIA